MSITKSIMDAVVDFIVKRKVNQLEKAFRSNKKLVGHIRDMYKAYDAIEKNIDDFCKKYPKACKDAEENRKNFRV
jgi:hypothetical protein